MIYQHRHECKFVVSEPVAARVLQKVMPHVEPDAFAAPRPGHSYPIASLYLDDDRDTLYRETIDGRSDRYKLRVRCYDDLPDSPVFLEVKRRLDRIVQKLRCPIARRDLAAAMSGDESLADAAPEHHRAALLEFVRLTKLRRVGPRCLVRYDRQAYVGRDDDDVRVTFDRRLAAAITTEADVRLADARYAAVPSGGVVLELKFTDRSPRWLADTIRQVELRRRSFSKYCSAVDSLLLARRRAAE